MHFKLIIILVLFNCFDFVIGNWHNGYQQHPGNFIIGQVLSINKTCALSKRINLDISKLVEVEALIYAVNRVRNETDLSIGYEIVDTCKLDLAIKTWFQNETNISRIPAAVITDINNEREFSFLASEVWKFSKGRASGLPLISIKHRRQALADTYSISPSERNTYKAIIKLVEHFQWNILDAITSNNDDQIPIFKSFIKNSNVCLLNEIAVLDLDSNLTTKWLRNGKRDAPVIVLFAAENEIPQLMSKLDRSNLSARNFMLGYAIDGNQDRWPDSMTGFLGLRRDYGNLDDFKNYLMTSKRLKDAVDKTVCVNISWENCDYEGIINRLSWFGSSTIDAVYAVVKARNMSTNKLPKTGLTGVRVTSATNRVVSFGTDNSLDEVAYEVLNFQKKNLDVNAVNVGKISISKKEKLSVRNKDIVWRSSNQPQSRCSANCRPGTRQEVWNGTAARCCWDCMRCQPNTVSSYANSKRCVKCPIGSKPTRDQTKCQLPYLDYLRWYEPFSLVMIFLLAFTICSLIYTVNLYVKKAHTPVFTRSKCACLPFLLSLFVTFVLPILLLMKPTESSCGAYNAIFVISLGIPLTFLIARSHVLHNYCYGDGGQLKRKWFHFNPQTAISFALIIFLLIYVVIYLSVAPVKVLTFSTTEPDVEYIECSSHSRPEFLPLVFLILVLVMVFNILHMNEIASPENVSEVKFVSLAVFIMYTIIFVYFVAVFGVSGKEKVRIICAMSFLLGFNFFVTIFLPKIYIIIFRPEDNLPEISSFMRNEDENGNSSRLVKGNCPDSPLLRGRFSHNEPTEV